MLSPNLKKQFSHLCYSIYPKTITASLIHEDSDLYPFLKKNRLDHYFAFTFDKKNETVKEYTEYKEKISASLKIVKERLKEKQYIVIKTFSCYPHITSDLDIIIKKSDATEKYNDLHLPIAYDISNSISWTNSPEISSNFIWRNIQKYNFDSNQVFIPNPDLDVLIRMGHLPFEQAEMKLGELLHIYAQFDKVNWVLLEKEASDNGWENTFQKTKDLLKTLHAKLFESSDFVDFPYRLSYVLLAQAIIEKKAWKKLWGARYIIRDRLKI